MTGLPSATAAARRRAAWTVPGPLTWAAEAALGAEPGDRVPEEPVRDA
jgi:hypothetical protein